MRAGFAPFVAAVLGGAPLAAQELRPAPDYFVTTIFEISTAQALARSCRAISVDPAAAARRSEKMLERLAEDGFDPAEPYAQMQDPGDDFTRLQAAFVDRHRLEAPDEAAVCAAARAEMADATGIGAVLVEEQG